jgi:glyoxylase-like metal-dependent hydrolase (beta-lactamase superfamily II)
MDLLRLTASLSVVLTLMASPALTQTEPVRSVELIAGNVYHFRNNNHFGIFAVTSDGVVLVDPISSAAGQWVRGYIDGRFPGQRVRTIIYSHHDGDHAGGAEAFKDLAPEIIAHENAPRGIAADPRVTVMPTRTFNGRLELTYGDTAIELFELGPGHTDNLIGVRFPREGILFVVDIFSGKRLPFNGLAGDVEIDTVIGTLRRMEALDFRILACGHTGLSSIAELVAYRTFLENLRAQVLQARRDGRSADDMKRAITMPAYADWANYSAWLPPSIENMNAYLERIGAR